MPRKKSSGSMNFEETIKYNEDNKHITLQKLIALPFEKLHELEKYYYEWYKSAKAEGYAESAEVNYLHYRNIDEAIQIKKSSEEQAWDYLT